MFYCVHDRATWILSFFFHFFVFSIVLIFCHFFDFFIFFLIFHQTFNFFYFCCFDCFLLYLNVSTIIHVYSLIVCRSPTHFSGFNFSRPLFFFNIFTFLLFYSCCLFQSFFIFICLHLIAFVLFCSNSNRFPSFRFFDFLFRLFLYFFSFFFFFVIYCFHRCVDWYFTPCVCHPFPLLLRFR